MSARKRQAVERTTITLSENGGPHVIHDFYSTDEAQEPEKPGVLIVAPIGGQPQNQFVPPPQVSTRTCQGCKYRFGPPIIGKAKDAMSEVYAIYLENRNMDEEHLADLVSAAFEERVVLPALENGSDVDPWLPEDVIGHFHHQYDPYMTTLRDIRDTERIERRVTRQIFQAGEDEAPDAGCVTSFVALKKLKRSLIDKL
jgi:hypothetical protein